MQLFGPLKADCLKATQTNGGSAAGLQAALEAALGIAAEGAPAGAPPAPAPPAPALLLLQDGGGLRALD